MDIKKIWAVYFSPVGTTRLCVTQIAERLTKLLKTEYAEYDFTLPKMREGAPEFCADELVVFGTPVYAGRIPNKMLEYVSRLKGNRTPVVMTLTYGSRSFQDGLSEQKNVLTGNGFIPVGAAAFDFQIQVDFAGSFERERIHRITF